MNILLTTTLILFGQHATSTPILARAPVLVDLGGRSRSIPAEGAKATVVIFLTTDCPIANRLSPEMRRIAEEFAPRGAAFYFAYVDPTMGREQTKAHFRERKFVGAAIFDERHEWVRALGATKTPEAMVIDSSGTLIYRGRIDNTYEDHFRRRVRPSKRDLRDAIVAVLNGRKEPIPETLVVGCDIPRIDR